MAQTYQNIRIIITLGIAALATACSPVHETKSQSGAGGGTFFSEGELTASASAFEASLYGELQINCQECHTAGDANMPITSDVQEPHDIIEDLGYVELAAPSQSRLVLLANDGHQGVTATQATAIENAIQSWANILSVVGETNPVGDVASLSSIRRVTLTPKCMGCHSGANPAAGFDVTDFGSISQRIDTANPEASELYQRITSNDAAVRMPRGADPLDQDEIDEILTWITEGGLNN